MRILCPFVFTSGGARTVHPVRCVRRVYLANIASHTPDGEHVYFYDNWNLVMELVRARRKKRAEIHQVDLEKKWVNYEL